MGDREETPEDCIHCGACCFSESIRHARVTGDDHARLGDDAERLVRWAGNLAFMRLATSNGIQHCAALVLDPGAETFSCSVYPRRPQVCRDLERGSGACLGELATKGDRPPRALLPLSALRRPAP